MSPRSSHSDSSIQEAEEEALVAAFDRYLPAMLRLTRGSAGDLVEACVAMPPRTSHGGGEALPVALFRSIVEFTRREPRRARSLTAGDQKRWCGGLRSASQIFCRTRVPLRKPVFGSVEDESDISVMLPQAIDDLPRAVREVVVLRDVAGLSPFEVEAILVLSQRKQAALLSEGRLELCVNVERGLRLAPTSGAAETEWSGDSAEAEAGGWGRR